MSWKSFFIISIVLSLPVIFANGYVIDWVPEVTIFQKAKGYVVEALTANFLLKLIIAFIVGLIVSLYRSKRSIIKS